MSAFSDRDTLRWACQQLIPCAVVLPGLAMWGRSVLVDLREGGPRPHLAIAQLGALGPSRVRDVAAGDTVRLWSSREGRPFHLGGSVAGLTVVEGSDGPVAAALVRLPFRLHDSERRLGARHDAGIGRLRIDARRLGEQGSGAPRVLQEGWLSPGGEVRHRGNAHVVEIGRRSLTFSLPARDADLLPGANLEVGVELPDLALRTRVSAQVVATMAWDDHILFGLSLGGPAVGVSAEEHRETLRRAADSVA